MANDFDKKIGEYVKEKLNAVSFSGGKDSTAMLLMMKEKGMPIDLILYCDTGLEFPAMHEHIDKIEKFINLPIIRLKSEKSFEYWFLHYVPNRKNSKLEGLKGLSWSGPKNRWCTSKLKINVINQYLSDYNKRFDVVSYVGIAADEKNRIKDCQYPLVIWNMTEADCLQYCYDRGFDFGGLYEFFKRVSCWCCPLQSLEELRKLRVNFPVLWKQLQKWDSETWRRFRFDFSVEELEIRFQLEDERTAEGLSIKAHNKEFSTELKKRLNK